jgi:hypothetical protein
MARRPQCRFLTFCSGDRGTPGAGERRRRQPTGPEGHAQPCRIGHPCNGHQVGLASMADRGTSSGQAAASPPGRPPRRPKRGALLLGRRCPWRSHSRRRFCCSLEVSLHRTPRFLRQRAHRPHRSWLLPWEAGRTDCGQRGSGEPMHWEECHRVGRRLARSAGALGLTPARCRAMNHSPTKASKEVADPASRLSLPSPAGGPRSLCSSHGPSSRICGSPTGPGRDTATGGHSVTGRSRRGPS